jgi:PEP-CTERM motif
MHLRNTILTLRSEMLRAIVLVFHSATGRLKMVPIPARRRSPVACRAPRVSLLFSAALAGVLSAFATGELRAQATLGFDPPSLPATTSFSLVPNGYGGLNWDNVYYINQNYLAGSGYDHGTVSQPDSAFNGFGTVATIVDPTAGQFFNFNSAELTAGWINGLHVRVDGFNTNISAVVPLYSTTVTVNTAGPTLFDFTTLGGFLGVNKLSFSSFLNPGDPNPNPTGTEFVMDDFRYTTTPIGGGTPEPGSLALAALGSAGLILGAWRKRANGRRLA